jgi:hypothetical protein
MKKIKYFFLLLLLFALSTANAQEGNKESTVGTFMRSNERSYVVIAVILTILIGLILYLIRLDRKLTRLEKEK